MFRVAIRYVLDQLLDPAPEVRAQLVQHIGLDVRPMLVRQLRKRHAIEPGRCGDLLQLNPLALPELEIGNPLFELES